MPRTLPLAAAALAVLAGCLGPGPPPEPAADYRLACIGSPDWSDPCTSRATVTSGPANENWLAVNPTDPLNVVTGAKDYHDAASSCVWGGVTVSKDGGATWAAPAVLTDDDTTAAQFHPMLAVDAQGRVHVTYYDRRYDPDDKLVDLTWAVSEDGATFRHTRVTASGFDGDLGIHQDGFPFLGDYNGLGCAGAVCYASWADTRMGRGDIAVARMALG